MKLTYKNIKKIEINFSNQIKNMEKIEKLINEIKLEDN